MSSSGEGIGQEENGPDALFRLAAIKGVKAAERVGEAAVPHEEDAAADSPCSSDSGDGPSDEDTDDARRWVCIKLQAGLALRIGGCDRPCFGAPCFSWQG